MGIVDGAMERVVIETAGRKRSTFSKVWDFPSLDVVEPGREALADLY